MFISYAQNFEDVLLNRIFKDQQSGFYIDVGAHHPTYDSITKSFYDRGWNGINIEPVTVFFELLKKERNSDLNLNFAISDVEGKLDFFELIDSGFSTFNEEMAKKLATEKSLNLSQYKVSTTTLADICNKYVDCAIDFLKIDVEGWEEKVILGHDWEKFRPKIVIVEATIPDSSIRCETKIPSFLEYHNYQQVYFDGLNDFYLAKEVIELKKYFQNPVNVFDDFTPFKFIELQKNNENLNILSNYTNSNIDKITAQLKSNSSDIHSSKKQSILKDQLLTILKNENEDQEFEIKRLRKKLNTFQKVIENKEYTCEQQILELQTEFNQLKRKLWEAEEWVKAMESSKFWQIRNKWFQIKKIVGISKE